ncbi:hypothetical protein TRAPUB_11739 [Trametes pubescens]|uniref:Uncharacterized protein n=1 Tax=Trametes pubescens TaxID=154538 RepID=A0A1M2VVX3_TRAPU|nr:hypothetical protein TRAPUB_11739 [Trametes pubescens]
MASSQDRPSTHIPLQNRPDGPTRERPTTDFQPALPTETAPATEVNTLSQQAATQPGAGGVKHTAASSDKPSFPQQVVGYAKEIRGTILKKPETKDYGAKIVAGEEPWPPAAAESSPAASAPQ